MNMNVIWKKQLNFVKAIAEDILAHNGSKEVLDHASGYAHIEIDCCEYDSDNWEDEELASCKMIRISWGEAYAYIYRSEESKEFSPTITWANDEMAGEGIDIKDLYTYSDTIKALDSTEIPLWEEYEDVAEDYELPYIQFAA